MCVSPYRIVGAQRASSAQIRLKSFSLRVFVRAVGRVGVAERRKIEPIGMILLSGAANRAARQNRWQKTFGSQTVRTCCAQALEPHCEIVKE